MSDPILKAAAEEIKAVLRKHDIAGVLMLQSKTHGEWVCEISPSWSAAKLERSDGDVLLRVRCKREDFPSKEAQQECLAHTVGMLMSFITFGGKLGEDFTRMIALISQQVGNIEHSERED